MPSISQSTQSIENQLNSIKTYVDTSAAEKDVRRNSGNSLTQINNDISTQLNKISEQQKSFQRSIPNSMDSLLNFIGITEGGDRSETYKYLRQKLVEVAVKIEPQIQEILSKNAIKALGCSQEQTYEGFSIEQLDNISISQLPVADGIYIPVQSVDIMGSLKESPTSLFGRFYYEKENPSDDPLFEPYGGLIPFPMNKELNLLMSSSNSQKSFREVISKYYQGKSLQPLFDIQYTTKNGFGVDGDFFRVILLNRKGPNNETINDVGTFISDYYKTIKLVDPVVFTAQLLNFLTGSASVSKSYGPLSDQSKFEIIVQRILGLCFDEREEIDVSGVSKVGELDGVTDSFFELTEVDLRNIENRISNVQQGVIQFVDCENIKLPVNNNFLEDELVKFRNGLSGNTDSQNAEAVNKIIDGIVENSEWQPAINSGLQVGISLDKQVMKKLPIAIAAGVLTPKVLLPIYTLLAVVQNEASTTINQTITDTNNLISSANTESNSAISNSNQTNSVVTGASDFLQKFRRFSIEVVSEINSIFLLELFEILKRDIMNLLSVVVKDIKRSSSEKTKTIILRLVDIAQIVVQLVLTARDARKCKNLLDNIKRLIALILTQTGSRVRIPPGLLFLADALPGYSPERATINVTEFMQSFGLETGPLPDGTPNQMLLFVSATLKGNDKEQSQNSKLATIGTSPFGPVKVSGKSV